MRRKPLPCPGCGRRQDPLADPAKLPGPWLSCAFGCGWTGDELDWWKDA